MMKKYLTLVLVILVAACQKDVTPEDDPETKKDCLLTKMIQGTNNGTMTDTVFTFFYNDTGRLEKVHEDWLLTGKSYDFHIQYDNEGRLVKIDPDRDTKYSYNQRGLLSVVEFYSFDSVRIVFEYGVGDLPTGSKEYEFYNGQWGEATEKRYHFENGNMVKQEWVENGAVTRTDVYEYYDDVPNLKTLCLLNIDKSTIALGLWEDFLYFNKNTLKKSGYYDNFWDVKTDSGRIAHSRTTEISNQSGWVENRYYFYDCK